MISIPLRQLELLSLFLRGLSHTVRTPLSVIANEFHYLQSRVGAEECARGVNRTNELAELFHHLELPSSQPDTEAKLVSIATLVLNKIEPLFPIKGEPSLVQDWGVPEELGRYFSNFLCRYLSFLLEPHSCRIEGRILDTPDGPLTFVFQCEFPEKTFETFATTSLTQFQFSYLNQPMIEPPLLDMIAEALRGSFHVELLKEQERNVKIELSFQEMWREE